MMQAILTHILQARVVTHVLARVVTHVLVLPHGASHFPPHFASMCSNTRASTCYYARARLLFKNMRPVPRPTWNLGHTCQAGNQTRQREACGEGDVINFFSVLTAHWDTISLKYILC